MNITPEWQPEHFVFPGTDFAAGIEVNGEWVGEVDFGINPLGDRLYINEIEIEPEYQRRGIALSVLWLLFQKHQVPIVPLRERSDAFAFWYTARRRFAGAGAALEVELCSDEDLQREKQRWQHLVPESDNERSRREYWEWVAAEHAAGRRAGPGIR